LIESFPWKEHMGEFMELIRRASQLTHQTRALGRFLSGRCPTKTTFARLNQELESKSLGSTFHLSCITF
jgi:hypothetical protein